MTESHGDMVPRQEPTLTFMDLQFLKPSDVMAFLVYDHEECYLFGVIRDAMKTRRKGEAVQVWEARCDEVAAWNKQRSKTMNTVFIKALKARYGADNEAIGMYESFFGLAVAYDDGKTARLASEKEEPKRLKEGGTGQ